MKNKIDINKIILIISLTANVFLLLVLYIVDKGSIGGLLFDKNKAALVIIHQADRYIIDYIKDNMSESDILPSREHLYNYIRENPFLKNLSVEIIYSPQNLISFRDNNTPVLTIFKTA